MADFKICTYLDSARQGEEDIEAGFSISRCDVGIYIKVAKYEFAEFWWGCLQNLAKLSVLTRSCAQTFHEKGE